jgi:hypothetical protein
MADIGGLFTTPEQYQLAQQQAQQAQALQYAQLDPMARANYGTYLAGQQLGGVIGRALGGEDPQLKLISQRQQLASQLNPNDPESYMKIAEIAAQSGDQQFAIAVADAGRKAMSEYALIQQRARERQGADPFQQIIRSGKYTPASLSAYQKSGNVADLVLLEKEGATPNEIQIARTFALRKGAEGTPEYNAEFDAQLTRLTTKEPKERNIAFGTEAERKSKSMYGKPYADLTPEEAGKVDKAVEESEQSKAKAGAIILPNQPVPPKDWLAFSSQISKDPVMDRTSTIIADAPNALETIRMSTTNDIAAASLPGSLARLTGEGKNMSNQDVNRFARTGGLDSRLAQDAVGFFTGKKTNVTKAQAEQFATAVYRGALLERKKFIQNQAEQAGYDKTPNYAIAIRQIDDQLARFKKIEPSGNPSQPTASPSTGFDAEKEKRYQEWKAKQTGVAR